MDYNYMGIVNELCNRLNEGRVTSYLSFPDPNYTSHRVLKDSVNYAIRDINQTHYEWPFNHDTTEETLSVGLSRYPLPPTASTIDFDSFRIKENATFGNSTVRLKRMTYDDYLKKHVDQEYSTDESLRGTPEYVVETPSLEYIVVPAPDKEYEIVYEGYNVGVDLVNYDDVPYIPERFKHVIIEGALSYFYRFRGDEQGANISKAKFEEGLKRMRTMLVNRYDYVTSTYIQRGR